MFGVIASTAADCHPQTFRMREIPMAAFAATVHKSRFFQVGNQLSHFARHYSIKLVSQLFKAVKYVKFISPQHAESARRASAISHPSFRSRDPDDKCGSP